MDQEGAWVSLRSEGETRRVRRRRPGEDADRPAVTRTRGFSRPSVFGGLCGALWLCAGCATGPEAGGAAPHPDFTGVWSGSITTQDNPYWQVEDMTCFAGCTPSSYAHLAALLDDPANDDTPIAELTGPGFYGLNREEFTAKLTPEGLALQEAHTVANDPALACEPYGFVRAATNPLPMRIHEENGHLVMDYEEWNQSRTIYMDGRDHPADGPHTPLGHSTGRYDGDALVVETAQISGDVFLSWLTGGAYSDETTGVERYEIRDDPRRLTLELTVRDLVTLAEPWVFIKTWLSTPDVELVEDSCTDRPGVP